MAGQDGLDGLRKKIDALDAQLLKVLASRMEVVREVGRYKKARGMDLRDEKRMQALLADLSAQAAGLDLPTELVQEIYRLIHEYAIRIESEA